MQIKRIATTSLPAVLAMASLLGAVEPVSAQQASFALSAAGAPAVAGGGFGGSVTDDREAAGVLRLTMRRAIELGLENNLGLLLRKDAVTAARGQRWLELSRLLPDIRTSASFHRLRESLAITGISLPGVPQVVGPYNYYDARILLTQRIFDLEAIKRNRAAGYEVAAAEFSEKDARELVILAVGSTYLQALTSYARIATVSSEVATANTILERAVEMHKAGVTPGIDELRARVEALARAQQLIVAQNDLAKEKLNLLRLIGVPVGQNVVLTDKVPFEPLAAGSIDELLAWGLASRADYRAAVNLVKAAEATHQAARAERLPSLMLDADFGTTGRTLSTLNNTYHIVGSLRFPIFEGGRVHGDVLRAEALVKQRREELDDLRSQIEFEVRTALLDVDAAAREVAVATENVGLAELALSQAQERFTAGINDNLEVVQAQQAVTAAHEGLLSSQYRHNLAKLMLARAVGAAETTGIGGKEDGR